MKLKYITPTLISIGLLLSATASHATHIEYFGEDLGLGETIRLPSHPNADAARAAFFSNLIGVGTEDFESYATGAGTPLVVTFPGTGTATLNGTGSVATVPTGTNGVGRYPISGDNYWEASSTFSIDFDFDVAAFGFYGIDIGDFGGQVTATLSNGSTEVYNIPNTINGAGGGVLYWGIIDTVNTYTSLTFGNTAPGVDFFGFDDFSIGNIQQVAPAPEPATFALMGLSLAGLGLGFARRRKSA